MDIAAAVFVILLGLLAAYPSINSRFPRLRDAVGPLVPHQAGIGMVAVLLGVVSVVLTLLSIGYLRWAPFFWLLDLAVGLLVISLGMLLGYELLVASLPKGSNFVQTKAANLHNWLMSNQVRLGFTGIGMGVLIGLKRLAY